jgi:cytochrome P450
VFRSVRNLLQHRTLELWRSIFSDCGTEDSPYTVETSIGLRRYILTADHQIIKSILATQFDSFGKGETFNHQWREFLGDSVFTTDGQEWHDSRQLIRPLFVNQRIGDLEIFEKYTRKVVDIVGREGKEIDLTPLFYRYTLDVATEFLFGQTVGSLEEPRVEFAAAIAEVQRVQARLARSG